MHLCRKTASDEAHRYRRRHENNHAMPVFEEVVAMGAYPALKLSFPLTRTEDGLFGPNLLRHTNQRQEDGLFPLIAS